MSRTPKFATNFQRLKTSMIIVHVKIWTTSSTNSENYPPQILPQFDTSMNSAAVDKQQGSRLQGKYLRSFNVFEDPPHDSSDSNDVEGTVGRLAFSELVEDVSDVPVNVVKNHIASGSVDDGFLVAVDGGLRTSAAEDVDLN
ncbi:hypothetical protein BYT27DRAFT_7263698 [Phlegmacium glaucopus]|nr:hypothetical protein BYT27DRAFT_7263698 [Phlegmacium glaucopus]